MNFIIIKFEYEFLPLLFVHICLISADSHFQQKGYLRTLSCLKVRPGEDDHSVNAAQQLIISSFQKLIINSDFNGVLGKNHIHSDLLRDGGDSVPYTLIYDI